MLQALTKEIYLVQTSDTASRPSAFPLMLKLRPLPTLSHMAPLASHVEIVYRLKIVDSGVKPVSPSSNSPTSVLRSTVAVKPTDRHEITRDILVQLDQTGVKFRHQEIRFTTRHVSDVQDPRVLANGR